MNDRTLEGDTLVLSYVKGINFSVRHVFTTYICRATTSVLETRITHDMDSFFTPPDASCSYCTNLLSSIALGKIFTALQASWRDFPKCLSLININV